MFLQANSMRGNAFTVGVLLLLLLWDVQTQEFLYKELQVGNNVSFNCSNKTFDPVLYENWKINRTSGSKCMVVLRFDNNNTNSTCDDPRITIQRVGDRSVLHIARFEHTDAGDYSCETVYTGGTDFLHFKVIAVVNNTIEDDRDQTALYIILLGITGLITVSLVISVIFMRNLNAQKSRHNQTLDPTAFGFNRGEELQDCEPYSIYIEKKNAIYDY
ncbi:uncharacterized protein LOC136751349 [Amia ocellicauda]|uniref:uncharacterized protein LOC136751349 n=1 Tax=Amia ocellicauda TaxID=2972642 RepID=UPI0034641E62